MTPHTCCGIVVSSISPFCPACKAKRAGRVFALVMLRAAWLDYARAHPLPVVPADEPETFPRLTNAEIRLIDQRSFTDEDLRLVFEVCAR